MSGKTYTASIRVYYKDTDCGGVVYYSKYADFMEIARTELLRNIGISVREMLDEHNLTCPVTELHIKYKKSAVYDDMLKIKTTVTEITSYKLSISYEISNQVGDLLVTGNTINCGVDSDTFKLTKFPQEVIDALSEN
jgi:acyl-CoA thioester hydrolase